MTTDPVMNADELERSRYLLVMTPEDMAAMHYFMSEFGSYIHITRLTLLSFSGSIAEPLKKSSFWNCKINIMTQLHHPIGSTEKDILRKQGVFRFKESSMSTLFILRLTRSRLERSVYES